MYLTSFQIVQKKISMLGAMERKREGVGRLGGSGGGASSSWC